MLGLSLSRSREVDTAGTSAVFDLEAILARVTKGAEPLGSLPARSPPALAKCRPAGALVPAKTPLALTTSERISDCGAWKTMKPLPLGSMR